MKPVYMKRGFGRRSDYPAVARAAAKLKKLVRTVATKLEESLLVGPRDTSSGAE
jgi:hypothetical protein